MQSSTNNDRLMGVSYDKWRAGELSRAKLEQLDGLPIDPRSGLLWWQHYERVSGINDHSPRPSSQPSFVDGGRPAATSLGFGSFYNMLPSTPASMPTLVPPSTGWTILSTHSATPSTHPVSADDPPRFLTTTLHQSYNDAIMFAMMSAAWDSTSAEASVVRGDKSGVEGHESGVEGPDGQGRATRGGEMGRTARTEDGDLTRR